MAKSSFGPGYFSTKKMVAYIDKCIKNSLTDENRKKLDLLLDTAARIEYWTLPDRKTNREIHYKKISNGKIPSLKMKELDIRLIDLTNRYFTFGEIFFDLWYELGVAIRNCIIGDYRNVAKSLRWILETACFWANFQLKLGKAPDIFRDLSDDFTKISKREYVDLFHEIRIVNRTRLEERLTMKHELGKPTFPEIANEIRNFERGIKLNELIESLKFYHKEFSSLIHVSTRTLEEYYSDELRRDFAFFQSYEFHKKRFDNIVDTIWVIVDMVVCIMIVAETYFYNYSNPKNRLQEEINYYSTNSFHLKFLFDKKIMKNLPNLNNLIQINNSK